MPSGIIVSNFQVGSMDFEDIPASIYWEGGNARILTVQEAGAYVAPLDRLKIMSAADFEKLVYQWAHFCLKKQYKEVRLIAGAGDQGRDVVGYKDAQGTVPRKWDLYQCKHYAQKLTPTDIYLELGKLTYYTFSGVFPIRPDKFWFVSPNGYGPKLQGFFEKPDLMRDGLIAKWKELCETKISDSGPILLEGAFESFVKAFDFSIVSGLEPVELLDQYSKTPFYAQYFGGPLRKRPPDAVAPVEIDTPKEARYVKQLLLVLGEDLKTAIKHHRELGSFPKHKQQFDSCRKYFYKAETLKEFARDAYPVDAPFDNLSTQIFDGIQPVLGTNHKASLEKLNAVHQAATQIQLNANILVPQVEAGDRIGICHHLVNDGKVEWKQEPKRSGWLSNLFKKVD